MSYISPERVAEIRAELDRTLPDYLLAIDRPDQASVTIYILSGPIEFKMMPGETPLADEDGSEHVNDYYLEGYEPEARTVLEIIVGVAKEGVIEEPLGEYMISPSHYVDIYIGMAGRPYKVKPRV